MMELWDAPNRALRKHDIVKIFEKKKTCIKCSLAVGDGDECGTTKQESAVPATCASSVPWQWVMVMNAARRSRRVQCQQPVHQVFPGSE